MSLVSNATKVSYFSGYINDKLVRVFTGSYNAATDLTERAGDLGPIYVYRIAHGLTRPVFCELLWSDDGGTTFYDMGVGNLAGSAKIAFSDSTYVYIFHGYSTAAATITYKVYCSWIENYDATDPLVDTISYTNAPIQFDSRLNFQKIYLQDELSFTPGTFGTTETQSISHPLGYTPNVKFYFEPFTNEVWPANGGGSSNFFLYDFEQDEAELEIYDSRVDFIINKFSNATRRGWYRIYYDAT